jgi:5-methylcytosine-specific restriction enzyme A
VEPPLPVKPPVHRPFGVRSSAEVKRELDRQRPSAARRGYGPRWRRARAAFLAQHPLCTACRAEGRVVPATVVDHVLPHRGDQKLFWDERNWAPACKPCHDAKTAREGRWG